MGRSRLAILLLAAALASLTSTVEANPRDVRWSELMPKGWDPMGELRKNPLLVDDTPEALKAMRELWDNAPTNPAIDGAQIRIPGYVVPLQMGGGGLKEFLLVPYFGACIHTPPPPANQIVHVVVANPAKLRAMDVVWVSGTLRAARTDSGMGMSGYRLEATEVKAYVPPEPKK